MFNRLNWDRKSQLAEIRTELLNHKFCNNFNLKLIDHILITQKSKHISRKTHSDTHKTVEQEDDIEAIQFFMF